jgi:hypothetical protein
MNKKNGFLEEAVTYKKACCMLVFGIVWDRKGIGMKRERKKGREDRQPKFNLMVKGGLIIYFYWGP